MKSYKNAYAIFLLVSEATNFMNAGLVMKRYCDGSIIKQTGFMAINAWCDSEFKDGRYIIP
jgi:hypothetical protein